MEEENVKFIKIVIDEELHKAFKIRTIEDNTTMQDKIKEFIEDYVDDMPF